jgi:hypothetical protein
MLLRTSQAGTRAESAQEGDKGEIKKIKKIKKSNVAERDW